MGAALAVAAALLLGVGAPMLLLQSRDQSGGDLTAEAGPASPVTTPSPLRALIPELQAFVEKERGLSFRRPVRVQILEDEAFERRIRRLTRMSLVEARRRQRLMQALGVIGPDVDFKLVQEMSSASSILGVYDPATSSLIVRGGDPTPLTRSVLVHELTHAVQDQHFDLERQQRIRPSSQGIQAVIEGDATRIQVAYEDSLTDTERAAIAEETAQRQASAPAEVPAALSRLNQFPYLVGEQFTSTVVALSGQKGLDEAFSAPPGTAEQILHPDRFLAQEGSVDVQAPVAEGRVVQEDTLGEFVLQVLLEQVVSEEQVRQATEGWGGDRYVLWVDGPRNCVRINIIMDSRTDADEMADALAVWAATSGATVAGRQPIVVTSCH